VSVRYVEEAELRRFDPSLRSFFNVNTPADLAELPRLLRE
jgi:molybdopterin-guanine dinucleotide biosynthesis protein A